VVLLTLGTFLMCTSEYLVAGLLPQMASGLRVSVEQAGLLITAFAVGMIVGGPVMAVATSRLPRRVTLVLALAVFAAGHGLAALSSDFTLVLAARVLTAVVTGAFWSVASAVATEAAGPAAASRALGVMMSGVGLATVVRVPLGSWAGQHLGWRAAFSALAAMAAAAAVIIGRFVPAGGPREAVPAGSRLAALRSRRMWLLLAGTVCVTSGYMATFSYISPLLTEGAGLPTGAVPLVLAGYGADALAGANIGVRFADRRPLATFITAAVATGLIQLLLVLLSGSAPAAVILLVLLGAAGMAVPPVATGLAVRFADGALPSPPGSPCRPSTPASRSVPDRGLRPAILARRDRPRAGWRHHGCGRSPAVAPPRRPHPAARPDRRTTGSDDMNPVSENHGISGGKNDS
jgi:DHA1 family inner membrane transport protein